jgi:glutathione synthase/RimK-type ligase-like ATP-grasp enzyme
MSAARVLVMGAGSAGAENLIRSLRRADPSLVLLGCNDDRFVLRNSAADERAVVPAPGHSGFASVLRRLVRAWRVQLVVPTIDRHVQALSDARHSLRGRIFLPSARVIALCRDKLLLATALRRHGVPAPETHPVSGSDGAHRIFERMGRPTRVWCRPRTGTCARGGAAVATAEEARRWMTVWETMQGVPASSFTLAEYLPGREILCQSVWRRGRMVLANTFERLACFGADNIPSGVTSLSSLAKTVVEPAVVDVCRRAIIAVAPGTSGAFSVDVKEDAAGRPRVTEINAGRLFMAMTAFDRVLKHSIALTYVRLALGERVHFGEAYDAAEDHYMVRDMDIEPGLFRGEELFDGVFEASGAVPFTVGPGRTARS